MYRWKGLWFIGIMITDVLRRVMARLFYRTVFSSILEEDKPYALDGDPSDHIGVLYVTAFIHLIYDSVSTFWLNYYCISTRRYWEKQ